MPSFLGLKSLKKAAKSLLSDSKRQQAPKANDETATRASKTTSTPYQHDALNFSTASLVSQVFGGPPHSSTCENFGQELDSFAFLAERREKGSCCRRADDWVVLNPDASSDKASIHSYFSTPAATNIPRQPQGYPTSIRLQGHTNRSLIRGLQPLQQISVSGLEGAERWRAMEASLAHRLAEGKRAVRGVVNAVR